MYGGPRMLDLRKCGVFSEKVKHVTTRRMSGTHVTAVPIAGLVVVIYKGREGKTREKHGQGKTRWNGSPCARARRVSVCPLTIVLTPVASYHGRLVVVLEFEKADGLLDTVELSLSRHMDPGGSLHVAYVAPDKARYPASSLGRPQHFAYYWVV